MEKLQTLLGFRQRLAARAIELIRVDSARPSSDCEPFPVSSGSGFTGLNATMRDSAVHFRLTCRSVGFSSQGPYMPAADSDHPKAISPTDAAAAATSSKVTPKELLLLACGYSWS